MEAKNKDSRLSFEWRDGFEVMKLLHISPRTLQSWRSNGVIGFSKIGNKIYYRTQDIEKMLEAAYIVKKEGGLDE